MIDENTDQRCACGEMLLVQCPGEWEPGCDLGANEAHVRVGEGPAEDGSEPLKTEAWERAVVRLMRDGRL